MVDGLDLQLEELRLTWASLTVDGVLEQSRAATVEADRESGTAGTMAELTARG